MPTYEYRCHDCGEHLEAVQSFTDEALTTCPNCGGSLRKVFGSVGIVFKGSGFYKTDNRSNGSRSSSAASESSTAKESSSSEPSSSSTESSPSSTPKESSSSLPAAAPTTAATGS